MGKRILIVEDDASIARLLRDNLVFDGFVVEHVSDGKHVLARARQFDPHLILLDLILPGIDGLELCRRLHQERERIPVIILTARDMKEDKIRGLELGADDYITKPFALDELLARMHAVLRRTQNHPQRLVLGDVTVDFRSMKAVRKEQAMNLTPRESAVLRCLSEHLGQTVTRDELLRAVWGYHEATLTRAADNLIARLRRKIEPDPHHPQFIRTAHGDGYQLTPDAEGESPVLAGSASANDTTRDN